MIKKLNLKDNKTAIAVMALQKASYKVEADIIGFDEIPPLKDTIISLQESDEIFYGYYINNDLAGIISYKVMDNILDIHRVAIHPSYFRMGIANKLVKFIEELECKVIKIIVCTGKANAPAVNLYLKNGFNKVKDIEISKGIYLTEFEKLISLEPKEGKMHGK